MLSMFPLCYLMVPPNHLMIWFKGDPGPAADFILICRDAKVVLVLGRLVVLQQVAVKLGTLAALGECFSVCVILPPHNSCS